MVGELKAKSERPAIDSGEIPTGEIPIFITKSNLFRVVHADGVYGGGTPTPGNIMMTVFSHRVPFPEKVVNDGRGNEVLSKREARYGIEQEFEVGIVMGIETAKIMLQWLQSTINNTEAMMEAQKSNKNETAL
jgi:hypothetical protein